MAFYKYIPGTDHIRPITAREADKECRGSDAGTRLDHPFVVVAEKYSAALDAARRWKACWSDENEPNVPDDLMLEEREYLPGKTYMMLRVL